MPSGVRAAIRFPAPGDCPLADLSERSTTIEHVSTSVAPDGAKCVTESLADVDAPIETVDATPIFSYGEQQVNRVSHDSGTRCPCEVLGEHGCPVHRYAVEDGALTIVFHAPDFPDLQATVLDLRECCPPVDVRRLLQPPVERGLLDGDGSGYRCSLDAPL